MIVKVKGRAIVLESKRTPLERAYKALRLTREVSLGKIVEVAKIYDVDIQTLSHIYWREVSIMMTSRS